MKLTGNKQAIFIRIPGSSEFSEERMKNIGTAVQTVLQQQFEKDVVVMVYNDDLHFMTEADIRDLIDTLENTLK